VLPSNTLSTFQVPDEFLDPDDDQVTALIARELGGVDISDASLGLRNQVWTARYLGDEVQVGSDTIATSVLFTADDITEIDLAFDQNMLPQIAYTQAEVGKWWWFDTVTSGYLTLVLPGAYDLRCGLDDKRDMSTGKSDVILAYLRADNLYMRIQRDRYGVEYLLRENINGRLRRFGMARNNRIQFEVLVSPEGAADLDLYILPDPSIDVLDDGYLILPDAAISVLPDEVVLVERYNTIAIEEDLSFIIQNDEEAC